MIDETEKIIKERNLNRSIQLKLLELNFNINTTGFRYWISAIKMYESNMKMGALYHSISIEHDVSEMIVEKNMRICSERAKPIIRKKYNYLGKITNKTILEILNMEGFWYVNN